MCRAGGRFALGDAFPRLDPLCRFPSGDDRPCCFFTAVQTCNLHAESQTSQSREGKGVLFLAWEKMEGNFLGDGTSNY